MRGVLRWVLDFCKNWATMIYTVFQNMGMDSTFVVKPQTFKAAHFKIAHWRYFCENENTIWSIDVTPNDLLTLMYKYFLLSTTKYLNKLTTHITSMR